MNRIDALFKDLRKKRRKALIVYIAAGDPGVSATERFIHELEGCGVDLIELGIPFSDPLADGPTIQRASERALSGGANVRSILAMVRRARKKGALLPIVFMTYYNIVLHYGIKKFINDAKGAGADGVIIPDLPPEEGKAFIEESRKKDFAAIFLASPTSTKERLRAIAKTTRGFLYYVSLTGTTGTRARLPGEVAKKVKAIKRLTKKPVCVGFGISGPRQARKISRFSDGVIIGSAVIEVIEKNLGKSDLHKKVINFVKSIEKAVH